MRNLKTMLDYFRGHQGSRDRDSLPTSIKPILESSSELEHHLPRLEFQRFSDSYGGNSDLDFSPSRSDSSSAHTADGQLRNSEDTGQREDCSMLQGGNGAGDGQNIPPTDGRTLLTSTAYKEEDPNLVSFLSAPLSLIVIKRAERI